jgi:hypothetical protein
MLQYKQVDDEILETQCLNPSTMRHIMATGQNEYILAGYGRHVEDGIATMELAGSRPTRLKMASFKRYSESNNEIG